MKTYKIIVVLLFLTSMSFYGQGPKDKVKALKVAFITKELALTSDEAEKFWPVYNAFEDKQFDVRFQKMRSIKKKLDNASVDKLTEKEATALLSQMEDAEEELYQNRKKLITSLKTIISPIKILKLKKAEDDFNRKLLKQYRDKKPERD